MSDCQRDLNSLCAIEKNKKETMERPVESQSLHSTTLTVSTALSFVCSEFFTGVDAIETEKAWKNINAL